MVEKRARILVVDDERDLRATMKARFEAEGYEALEAPDGGAALRSIARGGIDVVILDLMMPGMSGHEVLNHLAKGEVHPPVIILSAQSALQSRLSGLYEGAVDYLVKPFEPEELSARVAVALRQKAALEEARDRSRTDPLTGLGNRLLFNEALERETARARRRKSALALVCVDADGLKIVNDSYGHNAGDELLKAIARALRRACRDTDIPARTGGDEFAVFLPETDRAGAEQFASRLKRALAAERITVVTGQPIAVSASVGFSILGEVGWNAAGLCLAADEALYAAKRKTASSR